MGPSGVALPTEVKRLRGTLQPVRTNKKEPPTKRGQPPMPKFKHPMAKVKWMQLVEDLSGMLILESRTLHLMEETSKLYSEIQIVEEKRDSLEEGSDGWWKTFDKLLNIRKLYLNHLSKLGLTPVDKQRVCMIDKPVNEPDISLDMFN